MPAYDANYLVSPEKVLSCTFPVVAAKMLAQNVVLLAFSGSHLPVRQMAGHPWPARRPEKPPAGQVPGRNAVVF